MRYDSTSDVLKKGVMKKCEVKEFITQNALFENMKMRYDSLHSSTHSPGGATSREHNAPYGKILRYE
jgi:hypothetical protein